MKIPLIFLSWKSQLWVDLMKQEPLHSTLNNSKAEEEKGNYYDKIKNA